MRPAAFLFAASLAYGAIVPMGTEINVRLTDKVASEAPTPHAPVHAVVIVPVLVNGTVAIPAGARLTGTVEQAKAGSGTERAQLQMVFTEIGDGAFKAKITAVVASITRARQLTKRA